MVNEQLVSPRQKLAIVSSEVAYLQGLLNSFENLSEELQKRCDSIKNSSKFFECLAKDRAQKFINIYGMVGQNFRNFYIRFSGDAFLKFKFSVDKLLTVLKKYIRFSENNHYCPNIVLPTHSS